MDTGCAGNDRSERGERVWWQQATRFVIKLSNDEKRVIRKRDEWEKESRRSNVRVSGPIA